MADATVPNIRLEVSALEVVNFALQQNGVPTIRAVHIINETAEPLEGVTLSISATPALCLPWQKEFAYIPGGATFHAGTIDLQLDGAFLAGLTERMTGLLQLQLRQGETTLCSQTLEITALAYDEWHGYGVYPELLAAFVTPNHPSIPPIISRAAQLLGQWTGDPSLDGYMTQDPNRALRQAAAVYGALQEQNLVYCVPPASFEKSGQRVRLSDTVLTQKMGTCLDLSLLYASCLEAIGLHPLLLIKPGHVFAGVWLEDLTFPEAVQDDISLITKRLASGISQIAVMECTAFCAEKKLDFDEACSDARQQLLVDMELILDVSRARLSGIRPMPQRVLTDQGWTVHRPEVKQRDLTAAPQNVDQQLLTGDTSPEPLSKKAQWERKLLDLGLRNNLINMRLTRSVLPILTTSLDELENALADSDDFRIQPRPADFRPGEVLDFETMHDLQGYEELIVSEFKNKHLRTSLNDTELSKILKHLYRTAKTSLEENGANTLYLALGLLRWYESGRSTKARFAPIILLPVEIVRKSISQGYVIRLRDEDPQMNITILEKLKQDFRINISGLDPLPMDAQGIDTRKVFTILRNAVMNQPRWDVLESAYLGIFSFSQFVMWNDMRNRADDLAKNKIVRSLMDGKLCWDAQPMEIGEKVPENGVFLPLPADASQLFAIEKASEGESFVLHGPPGTGKSQTITTLIANALAQGKTVLFVAEKMAALEVVQRRLTKIGIGNFCLELHSNKSKKRDVLDQLRLTTEVTKTTSPETYAAKAEQIAKLRSELDTYAEGLHKELPCGSNLYDLVSRYEAHRDAPDLAPFDAKVLMTLGPVDLSNQQTIAERLVAAAKAVGHPHGHALENVCCTQYSQSIRHALPQAITSYQQSIGHLSEAANHLGGLICLDFARYEDLIRLSQISRELELWLNLPQAWAKPESPHKLLQDTRQMAQHFLSAAAIQNQLLQTWKPEFLNRDGKALAQQWDSASGKWFLGKMMGQNSLVRELSPLALTKPDKSTLRDQLADLCCYQSELAAGNQLLQTCAPALGGLYRGNDTNWNQVLTAVQNAIASTDLLDGKLNARSIRMEQAGNSSFARAILNFNQTWVQFHTAKDGIYDLLALSAEVSDEDYLTHEQELCRTISAHSDELKDFIAWNSAAEEAAAMGLGNLVDAYRSGVAHDQILPAYHKAISQSLAMAAIDRDEALRTFSGAVFNEKIQQFKRLDDQVTALTQQEIFCRLAAKVPNFTKEAAHSSELGILQRAIRSGGRGVSIRKLFEQIPNLLPRLCPCMLMSPISAAQYLDPNRAPFDLVVFDEASQLPTCKAVGALARGKDAIVVGDPKQMPPTSFFSSNTVDEENLDMEDLESILDDCLALNIPQTHLLWHYRSRHESLIAFSNSQFYENKLYTFPSVNDRASKVKLVHVDGTFERGKQRQNRAEAEAIVEELKRRCHDEDACKQSVGVVTFNIQQQHLIDDLLQEACRKDNALETWAFQSAEPVFIKNLENVQGDERDVILFSIGYGPDESGKVYMNFGPLNREGGWRRLNVAITRARQEMTVFATLKPEQINLTRTSAQGVAALKGFLEYAQGQTLPQNENTIRKQSADTDGIAQSICSFLAQQGYATEKSVGHSEYRIDIGVIDPKNPESYLLGILLDGGSYADAKTTRDREIAQIGVLAGLGWQTMRVWTMDWWDNSQRELNRILKRLQTPVEKAKEEEPEPVPAAEPAQTTPKLATPVQTAPALPVYTPAVLKQQQVSAEDLLQPKYAKQIRSKLSAVLEAEAPISKSLLIRRVVQSYDIARSGSRIQKYMDATLEEMQLLTTTQEDETFLWAPDQDPETYQQFRTAPSEAHRRDARDIPYQEAAAAACYVLREQISLSREDLIRESAKALGFSRLGNAVTLLMENAIRFGIWKRRIVESSNGNLTLQSETES